MRSASARSRCCISAIFAWRASTSSSFLAPCLAAFNSTTRSFIAARSASVNPDADEALLAAVFLAVVFLAVVFLAGVFLAGVFLAGLLRAVFLAAVFLAAVITAPPRTSPRGTPLSR